MRNNVPSFESNLNMAGAFGQGMGLANQIVENRLKKQQLDQSYDINNRQVMLQEQEAQQKQAFQKLAQEAYKKPDAILPQLYARDPKAAALISEGIQQQYNSQYGTLKLLKEAKAENKQAVYDALKPELQRQFPELEFGDKASSELMRSMDAQATAIKAKMKTNLEFRETGQGIVGFNSQTGEGTATGFSSKPNATEAAPSAVREYQYFNSLSPQERAAYLNLKRNTVGEGMTVDSSGNVTTLPGYIPGKGSIEEAKASGKKEGELATEKKFAQPKAKAAMESTFAKNDNVINLIDETIPQVTPLTSGFAGSTLSKIPGSDARNLEKQLKTIVANLGFDELQEMKNNSPTGGALGQIAVQEIQFLQSVKANLEQDQDANQLVKNMRRAKNDIIASKNRIRAAYNTEYGNKQADESSDKKIIKWGDL